MKKKIAIIICSFAILSGCGDTTNTYNSQGAISVDNSKDDHSKNTEGQVAVSNEVDVDTDVDKSTNNNTRNDNVKPSVKDSDEYKQLQDKNEQLEKENVDLQNKIEDLENQQNNIPTIEYKDFGLSINGEDIPIDKSNSMIIVNGKEYVSKEIADKLILDNQNLSVNDDTLYIGKIVSEKANLFDKHVNDQSNCSFYDNSTDSYGNLRSNILYFNSSASHNIIFTLNRDYSFLKFTISIGDKANTGKTGNIVVKADNETVYSIEGLNKQTEPFETPDIPINNCSLLTIEYNSDYDNECIISDAIVYNANTNE